MRSIVRLDGSTGHDVELSYQRRPGSCKSQQSSFEVCETDGEDRPAGRTWEEIVLSDVVGAESDGRYDAICHGSSQPSRSRRACVPTTQGITGTCDIEKNVKGCSEQVGEKR